MVSRRRSDEQANPSAQDSLPERLSVARRALANALGNRIPSHVILSGGSGGTSIENALRDTFEVDLHTLPGNIRVAGIGRLTVGLSESGERIAVCGPIHAPYEAPDAERTLLVRLLREVGTQRLVITCAGASLRDRIPAGSVAIISDHIDLANSDVLRGDDAASLGPAYPDMTHAYTPELRLGCGCELAVAASVRGPQLPTPAEYRSMSTQGADVVAVGLAAPVIVAAQVGLEVACLMTVIQRVSLDAPQPVHVEAMTQAADRAAPTLHQELFRLLS